jgi:hypothetical protein
MRILLPLSFLFCSSLNAQTIFAPIGAAWSYTQDVQWSAENTVFTITTVGDTLIQGINCSVLDFSGGISECMGFRQYVTTIGDSVVFWEPMDSTYRTLYVFGLSPGEGWQTLVAGGYFDIGTWVTVYDTLSFQVTNSDTVEIEGLSLRRSLVQANWSPITSGQNVPFSGTIIERLGHSGFMFPWIDGACDFEITFPFRCYSDDDISWLDPQFPQCELSVGLNEVHSGSSFEIHPTLAASGEPFQLNGPQGTVILLDAVGRVVLQRSIEGPASFDLDDPGTYIVRFTASEGGTSHQRIVVR